MSVYTDDESDAALEGWARDTEIPRDAFGTVQIGARHFIACLLGEATPVLTAEHARHVLDVILAAYASIEDGRAHDTSTMF